MALIGGGIVGAATALAFKHRYPDATVVLIEKEPQGARHQTGHNSGVIHAGVYYQPGSLKARFCREGARATLEFCQTHHLPFRRCGKLLVATTPLEMERMAGLKERCTRNRIATQTLGPDRLRALEPDITGLGALKVEATAITDYSQITTRMMALFQAAGGTVKTGHKVRAIQEGADQITLYTPQGRITTRHLMVCAGLMADRMARMMHIPIDFQIIPFRGEYYALAETRAHIVSHLIYPIPDPSLPFLGVHLTPMISGEVTVGPNAVLGFKREGYGRFNLDLTDTAQMMGFPGFWKVMAQHLPSGVAEWKDSLYKPGYLKRIQKYCPSLCLDDLTPYPPGIRAQAVKKDGTLVHDFLFAKTSRSLHVCNAPSPAATAAIPISHHLCDTAKKCFSL